MESYVTDKVSLGDWIVAGCVGVLMAVLLWLFSCPGLDPALWDEAACARGLTAPQSVFGSVCRLLPGAMTQVGGWVGGGLLAFLLAMIVRSSFVLLVRQDIATKRGWRVYADLFAACAAVLAVCSSPVWHICQALTPALFQLLGLCTAALLYLRWLTVGRLRRLLLVMAVLGLFAADGPYAFVLLLAGFLAYGLVWKDVLNGAVWLKTELPDYDELPVWRMMVSFLTPLAFGALVNMKAFSHAGGLAAAGWSRKNLLFHYAMAYGSDLIGHHAYMGFVLFVLLGVLPFFVALRVMIRQAYDESEMSFPRGCAVVLTGVVALMQILPYPSLWFWRWSVQSVDFSIALPLTCCFAAVAVSYSLMCFVTDDREVQFEEHVGRGWVPVLLVCLTLLGLRGVYQPWTYQMQSVLDRAIALTVDEMKPGEWIFTDGVLDRGLELEAHRRDGVIHPINLLASISPRETHLRDRGLTNATDRAIVRRSAFGLLRHWSRGKGAAGRDVAVQLGQEEFATPTNAAPVHGAVASWASRSDTAARETAAANGRELSEFALEVAAREDLDGGSLVLIRTFNEVLWRLACQARRRGENDLADRLDAADGIDRNLRLGHEAKRLRPL